MKRPFLLATALLAASSSATAETRSHDAHVHGVAEMDVALVGERLEIELRSPAANLVGFEHAPRTDEQEATLRKALAALETPARIVVLPGEAQCSIASAGARRVSGAQHSDDAGVGQGHHDHGHDESGHEDHAHTHEKHAGDGHDHDEHGHEDEAHAELHAHYRFDCLEPQALNGIELRLFAAFPATESVKVRLITESGQRAVTVGPDTPRVEL